MFFALLEYCNYKEIHVVSSSWSLKTDIIYIGFVTDTFFFFFHVDEVFKIGQTW